MAFKSFSVPQSVWKPLWRILNRLDREKSAIHGYIRTPPPSEGNALARKQEATQISRIFIFLKTFLILNQEWSFWYPRGWRIFLFQVGFFQYIEKTRHLAVHPNISQSKLQLFQKKGRRQRGFRTLTGRQWLSQINWDWVYDSLAIAADMGKIESFFK